MKSSPSPRAGTQELGAGAQRLDALKPGVTKTLVTSLVTKERAGFQSAVSNQVSMETKVAERQIVEANAQAAADIRLAHRSDIRRNRAIVARLMDELEAQVGPENAALLADLGEMMRSPDDAGQDKLNDLYRKIISLPERAKTAKTLAETLRITVDMERQAFGMDAKGADSAPGAPGYVPPSVQIIHVAAPKREDDDE